jgi:hypothetical protein
VKISGLHTTEKDGRMRVGATITWEDTNRPAQDIYFETPLEFAGALTTDYDAFVIAAIIPAYWHAERRVAVDGPVCPTLHDGLRVAMAWLHACRGVRRPPLTVDARPRPVTNRASERAGCFLSGGIDSLSMLRRNRLQYPRSHPASIRDGIIAYGLEVDDPETFADVVDDLMPVARDADVALISVYTNIRALEPSWALWNDVWQGAVWAAIAHALKRRLTIAYLASSTSIPYVNTLQGTDPRLDPNYSSEDLLFRHDGIALSRFTKTRIVADWPIALAHLRVCNKSSRYRKGKLNCGCCEKCIRTQLALLCLGALDQTDVFQTVDLSEAAVRAVIFSGDWYASYEQLIEPLREIGRRDLARLAAARVAMRKGRRWRRRLAEADRRYLGGAVRGIRSLFRR